MTPDIEPTPPHRGLARRLTKELRPWVLGAVGAVPIVVAFTFVEPRLPAAWLRPAFVLITIAPFLIIGLLSRSTLWVLIIWLAPIVAVDLAVLIGAGGVVLLVGWILAVFWAGGMMLYERFNLAVLRTMDGPFQLLVEAGLDGKKRRAYREFRRALAWTRKQEADVRQLADVARATEVLHDTAARISALHPPDIRWAGMLRAAAKSFLAYAEMREGTRPLDVEEAKALVDRRDELVQQVLRADSVPYRILTFVPGSLFRMRRSRSAKS